MLKVLKHITVEPVAFFYMFAIFGEFTCTQDMIFVKLCVQYFNDSPCTITKNSNSSALTSIMSDSSEQLLYNNVILTVSSIIGSFIAGSYGDRFGRLVPIAAPPVLSLVAQILFIISAANIHNHFNILYVIMIGSFLGGISGGSAGLLANSFGFVADITSQKHRTVRIIALEANIFCGGFVGSILTGLIMKHYDNTNYAKYYICFGIFAVIHGLLVLYVWVRVRTVQTQLSRITADTPTDQSFTLSYVLEMFTGVIKTVVRRREGNNRKIIYLLTLCFILISYGTEAMNALLFLYVRNRPLEWDSAQYSFYNGCKFGATGAALLLLPLIQRYVWPNINDIWVAIIGEVSRASGLVLIGLATTTPIMYVSVLLYMCCEYPLPTIRSLMSKLVRVDERGKVLAFLALFQNLCFLSGGILFPILYKHEINRTGGFSGMGFEIAAVLQVCAIVVFM
ncbi:unnamed protein product [Oppiella nova]|uniref:Major facilitator superfamily (MFS) profile domain-containing protein n=1 Tax=Oppiella nova TaxID=334625 RepID=A0A7R9QP08_9ACAR|nr:unnamed protein product [Oppiella nova]CAG2170162.1 unnamed protein product [Oppiella nova]